MVAREGVEPRRQPFQANNIQNHQQLTSAHVLKLHAHLFVWRDAGIAVRAGYVQRSANLLKRMRDGLKTTVATRTGNRGCTIFGATLLRVRVS